MKKLFLKSTILLILNFFTTTNLVAVFFNNAPSNTPNTLGSSAPNPKLIACNINKPNSCDDSPEQKFYCQPLKFKYPTVANKNKGVCLPVSYQNYLSNTSTQNLPSTLFSQCKVKSCDPKATDPAGNTACACGDVTKSNLRCEAYNPTSKLFTASNFGICWLGWI